MTSAESFTFIIRRKEEEKFVITEESTIEAIRLAIANWCDLTLTEQDLRRRQVDYIIDDITYPTCYIRAVLHSAITAWN